MDVELDWLSPDADEEVVWADTPHPYSLVPAMVAGVALAVVLVGIVIAVGAYLAHRNTNYVVTTAALYKKTGVFSRNVQRIEFDKVQDTSYRQSVLGARFGYGTVDISTAGGGGVEMRFGSVADPQRVQSLINERVGDGRRTEGEGRTVDDVLGEILDELIAIRRAVADGDPAGTDGEPRSSASAADPADTARDAVELEFEGRPGAEEGERPGTGTGEGDENR